MALYAAAHASSILERFWNYVGTNLEFVGIARQFGFERSQNRIAVDCFLIVAGSLGCSGSAALASREFIRHACRLPLMRSNNNIIPSVVPSCLLRLPANQVLAASRGSTETLWPVLKVTRHKSRYRQRLAAFQCNCVKYATRVRNAKSRFLSKVRFTVTSYLGNMQIKASRGLCIFRLATPRHLVTSL